MKKIRCDINNNDYIKVQEDRWLEERYCAIDIHADSGRIILSPAKIRKLRKQLKRVLMKIEVDNGPQDMTRKADGSAVEDEKKPWIPKLGDRVKFVDEATLDVVDKCTWHPKVGEIYVVRHVYDGGMYKGFSLMETPDEKRTHFSHGYKFRASGFEPVV